MNSPNPYQDTVLGAEAGQPASAHTLGEDLDPPPRRLRAIVGGALVVALVGAVVWVQSVPEAAQTLRTVGHETDRALVPVLGTPELQTTRIVGELAGSDVDETLSAASQSTN